MVIYRLQAIRVLIDPLLSLWLTSSEEVLWILAALLFSFLATPVDWIHLTTVRRVSWKGERIRLNMGRQEALQGGAFPIPEGYTPREYEPLDRACPFHYIQPILLGIHPFLIVKEGRSSLVHVFQRKSEFCIHVQSICRFLR